MANAFGIDIGSNTIKIYHKQDRKIRSFHTVLAIVNRDQMYAYGN